MTVLRQKLMSFSCLAAASTVIGAMPALAQEVETIPDSAVAEAANQSDDVVVVTGTRIRRTNEQSPIPLQVFGAEDLAEIGTDDLAEAILQLPGVSSSISPQSSNNLIQTSGLSTISLRRLGDDRTLVLIDGKRAVSNSGNSDRVSLSTLPAGFVKRTEITTGGASAIYGSDAIAGVANFILEDSFEGIELDARWSTPEASGGEEYRIEGLFGSKFADDRGYILLGASWRDENVVRADSTRPLSIAALEFDDPSTSTNDLFADEINQPGCDPANEDRHCLLGSLSGSTPGGVFENGDAWFRDGQWFNDQSLQPADRSGSSDFFADFDGFNFRPGRGLLSERQILALGLHSTFEIRPGLTARFTGSFSDVDTFTPTGFETLNDSDTLGDESRIGNMASDHPFIPPEVMETYLSGGNPTTVDFDRRLVELGEQARINDRDTLRLIAGVEGEAGDLVWEAYATYGRFKQTQNNPNEYNFANARFALDIEDDGMGGFQCADAGARADGCVPLNIFGEGTISPAAADYIRYNGFAEQVRKQYTAGGYVSGPAFDNWAGQVQIAGGFEFRRESQNTNGDPDGDLFAGNNGVRDLMDGASPNDPNLTPDLDWDITSLATFPSVSASYNVVEGFAEIDVPIIADTLNIQGAARIGYYNTIGTIISYNAGAVWQVTDDIRVRGQYSRSQRAPNLTEIFSPPRPDSDSLTDPCDGLMPDGSGIIEISGDGAENADLAVVAANCLTEPGIQQFFADNPGMEFEFDGSTQGPNAGNPDVKEETANTFTAGLVLTPEFIPGFTLVGDYYRIKIEDAITSISTQNIVSLCYSSTDFPNNRFCDLITRNPVDGTVDEVLNFQENLNEEIVSGVDATLLYEFEPGFVPGEVDVDFRYSHYFKQETTFTGIGGTLITSSPLGEIGDGNDEFRARLGYRTGGFRATYTVTYLDGGVDDLENDPDPSDNRYFKVGGQAFHRIYFGYDFGEDEQFRIYGGVNNLFDNFGPLLPDGLDNGSSYNIVNELNDALGREFYIGARARF